jgi:hypothetical protein
MSNSNLDASVILRRAHYQNAAAEKNATPLRQPIVTAATCSIIAIAACTAEYYTGGLAFSSAFPVTNGSGAEVANELSSLRFPIIFSLLAGHVIFRKIGGRAAKMLDALTMGIGGGAIMLVLWGVGMFLFSTVYLTLGNADEVGAASQSAGQGLAIASALLVTVSFLVCHIMLGRLAEVSPAIAQALRERERIKKGKQQIANVERLGARVDVGRMTISEMERPDTLKRKAANEAGLIVGNCVAEVNDMLVCRKSLGDTELGPDDKSDVPAEISLEMLEQRFADLKRYSAQYFFTLLTQKDA